MGLSRWISRQLLRLPVLRDMARLAVEDFGHDPNIKRADTGNGRKDVGFDEPVGRSAEAGNAAEWPDPVHELNPKGHYLVRTAPPALIAFNKAGTRVSKLDWTVQGGNAKRREQFKYMIDHTPGWAGMLEWFCWAKADGLRIMQIKTLDAKLNPSQWQLPDLRGGGRLKVTAGGRMHWDGTNLYVARAANGVMLKEPELVKERDQFMVHRPGAGSSPAGDLDLGVALLNLCESWWDGFSADKIYKKRYNQEIYTTGRRKIAPPNVAASYRAAAAAMVELNEAGPEGVIVVSDEDDVKLRQLQTNGLQDLWHGIEKLAGIIYLLILGTKITSDTSDAAGVGSTGVGLSEELAAALGIAGSCAETINADLIPWYADRNEGLLEPLGEDEEECYVVPQAPKANDQGDVDTGNEDDPDDTEAEDDNEDTTGDKPGEDGRKGNPATTPATAKLSAQLHAHMATLAKPGPLKVPPVHPGCRCELTEDEVWIDAKDARVCPECRVYGAIYNALQSGDPATGGKAKLNQQQIDEILDTRDSKAYKAALEGDAAAEERAIRKAAEIDKDGIIAQQVKARGGMTPNVTELQDAIGSTLDESRAAAEIKRGTRVGGEAIDEAVRAVPSAMVPGAVVPEFVGAVVANGRRYMVVSRRGRWQVIYKPRQIVAATETSLALALLVLIALEEAERRDREAREKQRERDAALAE